jgi:peptidoglycan L-alanyl-D-glutamate endopeptidase CwlK
MPSFGKASRAKLDTCHPLLQELCQRVVQHRDITIIYGHRGQAEQDDAYARKASTKRWPDSKHNTTPSVAVDVAPWPLPANWGDLKSHGQARDLEWKERVKFYEVIALFRFAWEQMLDDFPELRGHYTLRLGADWDGDGDYRNNTFDDLPHIELVEVKH